MAHQQGHEVAVFLIDEGVFLAREGATENLVAPTGEEADVAMHYIIQEKLPVYMCTPCAQVRNVTEDQLIEGAGFALAKRLIELASDSKVLNFTRYSFAFTHVRMMGIAVHRDTYLHQKTVDAEPPSACPLLRV